MARTYTIVPTLEIKSTIWQKIAFLDEPRIRSIGHMDVDAYGEKRMKWNTLQPFLDKFNWRSQSYGLGGQWFFSFIWKHSSLWMLIWIDLSIDLTDYITPIRLDFFTWKCWHFLAWRCDVSYRWKCTWEVRRTQINFTVLLRTPNFDYLNSIDYLGD